MTGLPLDRIVADLRGFLVFGDGVISPTDPHRVWGERHRLHTYRRNHGSGGIWDGGREFIKQMEQIIVRWIWGVCGRTHARVNTHSHMYVSDVMQQMRGGEIKWRKMKWERKQKNIEYTTVDRPTHKQFKWKSETLESESYTSYITPKHHKHTLSVIYTTRGCLIQVQEWDMSRRWDSPDKHSSTVWPERHRRTTNTQSTRSSHTKEKDSHPNPSEHLKTSTHIWRQLLV